MAAFAQMTGRGWRVSAAVVGFGAGLPLLFWILYLVLPDSEPVEEFVRVEVNISDAKTGLRVDRARVRVYRRMGERELPDMPATETFDGTANLRVRPDTAASSLAYLSVDAPGYAPFCEPLVPLIERGTTLAGDRIIEAKLTPD